jgi:hypothetical protein
VSFPKTRSHPDSGDGGSNPSPGTIPSDLLPERVFGHAWPFRPRGLRRPRPPRQVQGDAGKCRERTPVGGRQQGRKPGRSGRSEGRSRAAEPGAFPAHGVHGGPRASEGGPGRGDRRGRREPRGRYTAGDGARRDRQACLRVETLSLVGEGVRILPAATPLLLASRHDDADQLLGLRRVQEPRQLVLNPRRLAPIVLRKILSQLVHFG